MALQKLGLFVILNTFEIILENFNLVHMVKYSKVPVML